MKFLVDNQLPTTLAYFLRSRGLDCQHVLDVGLAEAPDSEICRYAEERGRIIVTKDEDFLYLAGQPSSKMKVLSGFVSEIAARKSCSPSLRAYG